VSTGQELKLICGGANPELSREISQALGIDLLDVDLARFNDGEIRLRIKETVRGADVFVIQPTCPPVDEHLMELLVILDALHRASAWRATAVVPYYGYARQDRKHTGRVPITARLVANLLETAGANRLLTMDLHAGQIQGFFNIAVDNLRADTIFAEYYHRLDVPTNATVIVSPDVGGTARARLLAEQLNLPLAILEKRRSPDGADVQVMNVIGEVSGKHAIVVDDILSSGHTLLRASRTLVEHGALDVMAFCTHGVFSGDALKCLQEAPLKRVIVTNTIGHQDAAESDLVDYIPVGKHLAKTIRRIYENKSVSHLFPHY
jgi:ribose-phosphate pyrophosphokinase